MDAQATTTAEIEAQRSAWYQKQQPTFSDAIALVRQQLWESSNF